MTPDGSVKRLKTDNGTEFTCSKCGEHARKRPRTACACFSRAHIRGQHYGITTKRHETDGIQK